MHLFLKTLATLNVETHEAIIFEDSPNGISAARAAGVFVVRVPNPITALLKTEKANLTLDSLAQIPLQKMLNDSALL